MYDRTEHPRRLARLKRAKERVAKIAAGEPTLTDDQLVEVAAELFDGQLDPETLAAAVAIANRAKLPTAEQIEKIRNLLPPVQLDEAASAA